MIYQVMACLMMFQATAILMAKEKGEFSRISSFLAPLTKSFDGAYMLQDDAATISPIAGCELVVTTDTIVETIHFLGHEPASDIAAKLIGVNFSDLAGKGARPIAYSLNLSLPPKIKDQWLKAFCEELSQQQINYGCHLIGGDSVSMPEGAPLCLSITAFGEVPIGKMLRRNGAKIGDLICVSGTIGDGALGLLAARGELGISDGLKALINRYYRPQPRVKLGLKLQNHAQAAMDISDGLIADLNHMAKASGLMAEINIPDVPLSDISVDILADNPDLMALVLTGGDDYELLFTIASTDAFHLESLAKESKTALSVIGTMKEGDGLRALDRDGNIVTFAQTGFCHS